MEAGWFCENVCECESLIWYFFNLKCIFVIQFLKADIFDR